jgi:hypothetical protein
MDIANATLVNNAASSAPGSASGQASLLVLKKAISLESQNMMQLLDAVPAAPPLARSGSLGTRLNVFA